MTTLTRYSNEETDRDIYIKVQCPQCKLCRRVYSGELGKEDFPMCEICYLPMKPKVIRWR